MTIDKQVLRQIAESVDREEWCVLDNGDADYQVIVSGSLERGATYRSYQPVTNEISNKKIAAFIAAFNPKVALALLNEVEAAEHTAAVDHEAACSLVEENETLKRRIAEQREYYEGVIADGSKRIAELESKNGYLRTIAHEQNELAIRASLDSNNATVEMGRLHKRIAELEAKLETADKLQDSAFRHGLQHGFSYGQTNDQAGFEQCMAAYSQKEKSNGC
ncbi:ead/Ea22-like family protein [Salmonella enterica subsp. diarizonae serovar 58:r:z53]